MKQLLTLLTISIMFPLGLLAKKNIVSQEITYQSGGKAHKGVVFFDKSVKGKRPAILVVHEWWGCNDYAKRRAKMIAALGYVGFAVDLYGDGKIAPDPNTAKSYAMPFYENPELAKESLQAALDEIIKLPITDRNHIAGIGYCFGGGMLLNVAKLGLPLNGVVSFHGSLKGVDAKEGVCKAEILICHGEADKTVSQEDIAAFKKNMQEAKTPYKMLNFPDATHAFTNPDATALGKKFKMPIAYNEKADLKSWREMKDFLSYIFDEKHELGTRGK